MPMRSTLLARMRLQRRRRPASQRAERSSSARCGPQSVRPGASTIARAIARSAQRSPRAETLATRDRSSGAARSPRRSSCGRSSAVEIAHVLRWRPRPSASSEIKDSCTRTASRICSANSRRADAASMPSSLACRNGRFEHLLLALRVDDGSDARVLPRGDVVHELQPILHQLEHLADVCIRVGECRRGAGRRRQQEQKEDRERAGHGPAAYTFSAAASPGRAGG